MKIEIWQIAAVYISCGAFTAVIFLVLEIRKQVATSKSRSKLLDLMEPERRTLSYKLLFNVLAPGVAALIIAITWPAFFVVFVWGKLFSGTTKPEIDHAPFNVPMASLIEKFGIETIEAREIVIDPLQAVPPLPFGHLHQAWQQFINQIEPNAELWSFAAEWSPSWGPKEVKSGYAAVQDGSVVAFFVASEIPISNERK